jgi:aspartyl-tRNA(Asn)/glutamyl-tRNA(Gln) amidotransferase subunit A
MTDDDLIWLGAVALGRCIRRGEVTALRAAEAYLDRIARLDPRLEAYVAVTGARARAEATAADAEIAAGGWRGPLHGVPYCLKDIVQTAGIRTTAGSLILADWVPDADATVQTRLADAGAVLLGKVNTHEFAFGATTQNIHGRTRNPHDTNRIPGGSSGGSGAAVAAGLAAFSIGSDTAGSIRLPAAYCGVAGLKPTWGLVSAAGVVAQSFSSDHIGPLARSVGDLAAVMAVIAGPDPADPTCLAVDPPDFRAIGPAPLDGVRVGVPMELMAIPLQPAVQAGFSRALAAFAGLGATVRDVSVPLLARATEINNAIVPPETMAQHERWQAGWFRGRDIRYGHDVATLLAMGADVPGTATILAQRDRIELGRQLDQVFAGSVEVLLTPTQPMTAFGLDEPGIDLGAVIHFLCGFSLAGVPALALPSGADEHGLPVSVQIVGPRLHDSRVLAVGRALEAALGSGSRPEL